MGSADLPHRLEPFGIRSCEILSVGTELLFGQTVNTDAAHTAVRLSELGIPSYRQTVVGDNPERMEQAFREILGRSDAVVATGGLGPTRDDRTAEVLARVMGVPLEQDDGVLEAITRRFLSTGSPMTPNNRKQALIPRGALAIPNGHGTAPGIAARFDFHGEPRLAILLPGPPAEMRPMMDRSVVPLLEPFAQYRFLSRYIRVFGIGESRAETLLQDLVDRQENPTLAPYCGDGDVVFRATLRLPADRPEGEGTGPDAAGAPGPADLDRLVAEVVRRLGIHVYEVGDRSLQAVTADLLMERGVTVSLAESCTAGLACALLAERPGISAVLKGAVTAYDNDVKVRLLDVPRDLLEREGAVGAACAAAMADGCRSRFGTGLALSITGIAGPDGGTPDKPIGTVWLALSGPDGTVTESVRLAGDRNRIRRMAAFRGLDLIRRRLST